MIKIIKRLLLTGLATLSVFGFTISTAIAAPSEPNVNTYAQLPRTASVRVSPDGKYIAMLAPFRGDKAVFVYNLDDPSANTIIIPTPENSIVKAVSWASDKHIVMLARIRGKGLGKMKRYSLLYSRWVSTNVETQKSVILLGKKFKDRSYRTVSAGGYLHDLPNDSNHILMALGEFGIKPEQRHYRVNLDTGKASLKRLLPIKTGTVVFSPDGEKVLARSETDRRSGTIKVFFGEAKKERMIYKTNYEKSKNPTTFLFTVVNNKALMQELKNDKETLFTIDPTTKARAPFELDLSAVPDGIDYGPLFDPITDKLIGVGFTENISKEVYFAEPYVSWQRKAEKALRGNDISILSRTKDNSMVTLFAQSATNPGAYYLFEPKNGKISPLGSRYPELKPAQVAKTIRADFTARDGLKIPAYLTLPPGKTKSSGPMPMVVLPHGGPIARDTADFDFWAQYLAAKGYVVFKPQFRGSTGFGYKFEEKGYGEFGDQMLTDTVDGVRHLIDTKVANADKICVTGASYGGYQALALPMIEPDMFKCALSVNGVSHIPDILKFSAASSGGADSGAIRFWRKVVGDRHDDKAIMLTQSPAENVDKIKAEIVLVHGTDDMTVPIQQSEVMAKALKKAGRSGDIILLANDDHNLSLPISRKKLLEASDKLFSKHLD